MAGGGLLGHGGLYVLPELVPELGHLAPVPGPLLLASQAQARARLLAQQPLPQGRAGTPATCNPVKMMVVWNNGLLPLK